MAATAPRATPSALARAGSVVAAPLAPLYGAALSYLVYHPPRRGHHKTPADVGLDAQERRVDVPGSRVRLHLWWCAGRDPDRVVVVGHGIGLSKSASLAHARMLVDAGWTVCLFDHRNHGSSGQDRAGWGLSRRFTDDVAAVVAAVRAEWPAARVAVYGFSFSSFPVFYVLGRPGVGVDAVMCDSGPAAEIRPLFDNFLSTPALPVPAVFRHGPARAGLGWTYAAVATAMLHADWPPAAEEAFADTPMLFLAGADDEIVPSAQVQALAERYPRARCHVLPGTTHLQGVKRDPAGYREAVLGFLDEALAPR